MNLMKHLQISFNCLFLYFRLVDNLDAFFADLKKFATDRRMISNYKSFEYQFSLRTLRSKNKYCLRLIENSLKHREISSRANLLTYVVLDV